MTDRELDALMAEKVMRLVPCADPIGKCIGVKMKPIQCWASKPGEGGGELEQYSTDISAALQVVEKMKERGLGILIHGPGSSDYCDSCVYFEEWYVRFEKSEDKESPLEIYSARSESLTKAICLAALEAVGVEVV